MSTVRRQWLRRWVAPGLALSLSEWLPELPGHARAQSSATPVNPSTRDFPAVVAGTRLQFPRDHGAHPDFRTEWWYLTGWVMTAAGETGVQITFFRSRTGHDPANPSRFAPHQLLLAHGALARPADKRLRHEQRQRRLGFSDTRISTTDTDLQIQDWRLRRHSDDRYQATLAWNEFAIDLNFAPAGPPQLQGEQGYSRKGPDPKQASYYYSRPQLAVSGRLMIEGQTLPVSQGTAWLDHEWSSQVLDPLAVGWDWLGLNFDDGSALMAFQIRHRDGTPRWSEARWLPGGAAAAPPRFEVLRHWRSPRSGANYPVAMRITVDRRQLELVPLFDDQELDARASTGAFYWEGAVRAVENGRPCGKGYLELTGYAAPLRL